MNHLVFLGLSILVMGQSVYASSPKVVCNNGYLTEAVILVPQGESKTLATITTGNLSKETASEIGLPALQAYQFEVTLDCARLESDPLVFSCLNNTIVDLSVQGVTDHKTYPLSLNFVQFEINKLTTTLVGGSYSTHQAFLELIGSSGVLTKNLDLGNLSTDSVEGCQVIP